MAGMKHGVRRLKRLLPAAFCLCQAFGGSTLAADSSQFWPELSAFIGLRPGTRVYLDASFAEGKESDQESLDGTVALDVSLKPILRSGLQSEDWQRNRYLWTRIGYTLVSKIASGQGRSVSENRGIAALYARAPLPAEVWLEGRARVDLRWIGDDYSTRYRFQLEASREFAVEGRPFVPYFQAEWFYDTRYDGWARSRYQGGVEVGVNKRLRVELYLARQNDHLPNSSSLNALGLVAKWYF